jgi:hypothetical protein
MSLTPKPILNAQQELQRMEDRYESMKSEELVDIMRVKNDPSLSAQEKDAECARLHEAWAAGHVFWRGRIAAQVNTLTSIVRIIGQGKVAQ